MDPERYQFLKDIVGQALDLSEIEQMNVNWQDMHLYGPHNKRMNIEAVMEYLDASH